MARAEVVTSREELVRPATVPQRGGGLAVLRRLLKTRLAGVGLVIVLAMIVMALGADLISPYDPLFQDYAAVLEAPSRAHPMGTDDLGRDVLSRVIYGSRVSLQVGIVAIAVATLLGITLGLAAGYWGGLVDDVLMRVTDAMYSFPALILALAITAALGPSATNAMIAIGVIYAPTIARLVRGQALSVRERDFVTAARVLGAGHQRIMGRHIWPNVTAPIIVQASLDVAYAIITEASLSFLGVSVPPPTPTWGSMLRVGYQYMELAPWLALFPGGAIFLAVIGLNVLGDGLRQALDPRLQHRGA